MHKMNQPVRILQKEKDIFLLSVPRTGLRAEINKNVADFLAFIQEKDIIEAAVAEEYSSEKNIENVEDYKVLFEEMVKEKVLIEF